MKVTFVDHTASPGGAELSLARYLEWRDRGIEASLILLEAGYLDSRLSGKIHVEAPASPLGGTIARLRWLRRSLRGAGPVVVANSLTAAFYLAFTPKRGRKYLYYLREDLSPGWLSKKRRLFATWVCLPRFDGFIANSRWTASTLPRSLGSRPVEICYPISGYSSGAPRRVPADSQVRLSVLSLSRLNPWKGVDVTIDAVRIAQNAGRARFDLTIAGADHFENGDYGRHLLESASHLTPEAEVVGHVEDVDTLLASCDVLVLGSRKPEPFGQVVVQAMAAGRVVIATDHGGPKEIIRNNVDGFLVPPDSSEAVSQILIRLAQDADLVRTIAQAAVATAARFADERTLPQLERGLGALSGRVPK